LRAVLSSSTEIDCREAERRIHLYVDAELAPEECVALEVHLAGCDVCTGERAMLEKTRAALRARSAEEDHAPALLVERIRGDIGRQARREGRSRLVWAARLGIAAVALGVATFALLGGDDEPAATSKVTPSTGVVQRSVDVHTLDVPVDIASPDPARIAAFLEPRLRARVRVPRLDGAGLSLAGARVVSAAERRAAQLVYEDGLGARVTVLVVPDRDGDLRRAVVGRAAAARPITSGVQTAGFLSEGGGGDVRGQAGGNAVRLLHDGSTLFALVGGLSDDNMDRIAKAIAPELPRAVSLR